MNQKGFTSLVAIILMVVGGLIVAALLFYRINYIQSQSIGIKIPLATPTPIHTILPNTSPSANPLPDQVDTKTGWKIFNSSSFPSQVLLMVTKSNENFNFEYPNTWQRDDSVFNVNGFKIAELLPGFNTKQSSQSCLDYLKQEVESDQQNSKSPNVLSVYPSIITIENVIIPGFDAARILSNFQPEGKIPGGKSSPAEILNHYCIAKSGHAFSSLWFYEPSQDANGELIFNKVLSTVKFFD